MAVYQNLSKNENAPEAAKGGIFKNIQKWINDKAFFSKEINTNSDERVLTGYEYDAKKRKDFLEKSKSISESVNTFHHNRTERYVEYESMERVSEISSALDLIADEAVQLGQNGHVLSIKSKHKRVIDELEKLFFETLRIDNDCWDKVRGMCMYGDRFEEMVINRTEPGILYLNYIDPASIERVESKHRLMYFRKHEDRKNDENREYNSYMPTSGTSGNYGSMYQNGSRTDQTIQAFRIAHFRLEDARFAPYGKSALDAARKTVRQLNLLEDSVVTYRYARASEKRVWNIDCGELGPDDAMAYVEQVKNNLRKKPKFNPRTGTLDYESDPQCISLDTKIKLLDGRDIKLRDLIKEHKEGRENWTLSVDEKGEYHIGKIKWAGITRRNTQVVKVTLDDGSEHIVTPDHKFIMRDGSKVEAQDLKNGDSLMPLYTENKKANHKRKNTNNAEYEYYYDLGSGKEEKLYRKVAEDYYKEIGKKNAVHHIDFNSKNNNPSNLKIMGWKEHAKYHYEEIWVNKRDQILKSRADFWNTEDGSLRKKQLSKEVTLRNIENNTVKKMFWYNGSDLHKTHNKQSSESLKSFFSKKENRERYSEEKTMLFDAFIYSKVEEAFRNNSNNTDIVCDYINNDALFFEHLKEINKDKPICSEFNNMNRHFLLRIIRTIGFNNFEDYKQFLLQGKIETVDYEPYKEYKILNYSNDSKDRKRNTRMLFDSFINSKLKEATIYEGKSINDVCDYLNNDEYALTHLRKINATQNIPSRIEKFDKRIISKIYNLSGHKSFKEYKSSLIVNHKVVSVEFLDYKIDTGCIEVDNPHHNFPILCTINNNKKSYTFIKNSITEDFFIPIRTGMTNNSVTTLPGATNLGEINDLLYYKKKLFFALKIPLAFIGEEGLSYAKSNLALVDIRFAKYIERIQRFFEKGLEKIAAVHLLLKKFSIEEIREFKISMSPASNIREKTLLDEMSGKFSVMQAAKGLEIFPDAWILKEIWGASEEEAENIMKLMQMQKAGVQNSSGGGGGGLGSLGGLGGPDLGPEPGAELGAEAGNTEGLTPPEAGGGEIPPEFSGEEIAGGDAGGEPVAAESENLTDKEKMLIESNKKLYSELKRLKEEKTEFKQVAKSIINENLILKNTVDEENNFKIALKKLYESKNSKKIEEKKDNIKSYLQEFKVFGELGGFKDYESELLQETKKY